MTATPTEPTVFVVARGEPPLGLVEHLLIIGACPLVGTIDELLVAMQDGRVGVVVVPLRAAKRFFRGMVLFVAVIAADPVAPDVAEPPARGAIVDPCPGCLRLRDLSHRDSMSSGKPSPSESSSRSIARGSQK